jgi:hypothetical protein
MGLLEVGGALYVTIALAAIAKSIAEARHSKKVTALGLCLGLLLCILWLPTAIVLIAWHFVLERSGTDD